MTDGDIQSTPPIPLESTSLPVLPHTSMHACTWCMHSPGTSEADWKFMVDSLCTNAMMVLVC